MSSIALTAGTELIASMLSIALFGALLVVVFNYYQRFPDDRWYYRMIVIAMTAIAGADTAANCSEVSEQAQLRSLRRARLIGR